MLPFGMIYTPDPVPAVCLQFVAQEILINDQHFLFALSRFGLLLLLFRTKLQSLSHIVPHPFSATALKGFLCVFIEHAKISCYTKLGVVSTSASLL